MTITEIQNNAKTKMEKTKDVLRGDLMAIRAGRANPQLLDRITCGLLRHAHARSRMWLTSPCAGTARASRSHPWDAKHGEGSSPRRFRPVDLGLNPSNDGKVIRLLLAGADTRSAARS